MGNQDVGNRDEDSIAKQLVTETKTVTNTSNSRISNYRNKASKWRHASTGTCFLKREYNSTGKKEQVEIIKTLHFKDETVIKSKFKLETTNTSIENKVG